MNVTNGSKHTLAMSNFGFEYHGHVIWIACEASLSCITAALLYIYICIGRFAWKSHNAKKRRYDVGKMSRKREKPNSSESDDCSEHSRSTYKLVMVDVSLFAATATLLKFLFDQVKFFYAWNARSDAICEIVYDICDNALFAVPMLTIYGFLWMKQWLFYRDPAVVGILYNRKLVIFSRVFVVVLIALGIPNLITNIVPVRYASGNSTAPYNDSLALANDDTYLGCVSVYDMTKPEDSWPLAWYSALTFVFHITLLALFAYPLVKQRLDLARMSKLRERASRRSDVMPGSVKAGAKSASCRSMGVSVRSNGIPTTDLLPQNDISARYNSLSKKAASSIKRAITWTTICVVTDSTLFVIFSFIGPGVPLILLSLAEDIDLFVNIICLVMTYRTWREILFPMCTRRDAVTKTMVTA